MEVRKQVHTPYSTGELKDEVDNFELIILVKFVEGEKFFMEFL